VLGLLSFIFLLIPIVSIVLGAEAIKQINEHPEKYKNTWMPKLALVVGFVITGVAGAILLAIFISGYGGALLFSLSILRFLAIVFSLVTLLKVKKLNEEKNEKPLNNYGLISLVFAITSILVFPAILALIFGALSKRQIKRNPEKYRSSWMTSVGFIVGLVGSIIASIIILFWAIYFGSIIAIIALLVCVAAIVFSLIISNEQPLNSD